MCAWYIVLWLLLRRMEFCVYWDEADKLNWSVNVSIDCKVNGVSFSKRVLFILRFRCML